MANNNRKDRGSNKKSGNVTESSADKRTRLAKELRLKPKTKQMVDMLLEDSKLSQTEAYIRTHATNNRTTATVEASKLLAKPNVRIYKDSAVRKAKSRVVTLIDSGNESIALKAAQDVLDRTEGKAVQKSENINRTVEVKLDLTGLRIGSHHIQAGNVPALDE